MVKQLDSKWAIKTRRFQDSALESTKTNAIEAAGIARFAFETRPEATQLHDAAAEAMRELVRHRDRIRQGFDDRVRQLHCLVDLGFPRVHPICRRAGQHAGDQIPFRMPHRARLRPRHTTTAGQAALRRTPLGRNGTRDAANQGRQALRRPAPRASVSVEGPPYLLGPRPVAHAPARDRARHRRPA